MFEIAPRIVPITRGVTALTARLTQSLLDIITYRDSYEDARNTGHSAY